MAIEQNQDGSDEEQVVHLHPHPLFIDSWGLSSKEVSSSKSHCASRNGLVHPYKA